MKDIKIQLYKEDGKGVEGFLTITETSDFPITKALADIQDISKRKSTTSKSIKIGGTKENNLLLGNIYDIDTVSLTYDINKIQKCAVLIDGELFLNNCVLQLTDITKVQHNTSYESDIEYTVNIKTNNADFFSIIKNKELSDLTFGENEIPGNKFIFNSQNIINSFNNNYTDGFKYVLPHFTGNTPHTIPINTFRPAIYLRTYFDKILKEANFRYTFNEIQGSDNILHFNKILIPFLNKIGEKKTELNIFNVRANSTVNTTVTSSYNNLFSQSLTGSTSNNDVVYDVTIQDDTNSWDGFEYVSQFNGNLNIKTKATINATINNSNITNVIIDNHFVFPGIPLNPVGTIIGFFKVFFVINKNGVDIPNTTTYIGSIPIEAGTTINAGGNTLIGSINGEVLSSINVLANDVIKIKAYGQLDSIPVQLGPNTFNDVLPLDATNTGGLVTGVNYQMVLQNNEIVFESNLQEVSQNYGSLIDLNNFIPKKIKQSDFIKSILNMFNLYVIPDENDDNLLHFKTRDKFYDDGISYDWTDYLVKDKEQILNKLSQEQNKKKIFTYKEDKSPENISYTSETNEIYGQATFNFDDENIYNEDKVELIFSPSPFLLHNEDNMYLTDMPEDSGLRILYDGGLRNCSTTLLIDYNTNQINYGSYINQYPLSIHFDDEQNPTFDLNFSACPMYFAKPDVLTNNNLFNNFWRRTMHQLNKGYMFTAYFNLDENIVSSLKLNEKIYVDGKWYNINQVVDYNPAKSKIVKVELITIDDGANTYKGIVVNNTKPGTVRPGKNPGIVDAFLENNVIVANPGRNNTGTGIGNIIIGLDNLVNGDGNIVDTNNATVKGNNNEVKSPGIISGNKNKVKKGLNNVIVLGDEHNVTKDNTVYSDNAILDGVDVLDKLNSIDKQIDNVNNTITIGSNIVNPANNIITDNEEDLINDDIDDLIYEEEIIVGDGYLMNIDGKLELKDETTFNNDILDYVESNLDIPTDISELTDDSNLLFSGDYNDLTNKPTIPTLTSELTNDSDFQTSSQVTTAINTAISGVYKLKGSVADYASLPTTGNVVGDVWNTIDTGMNYVWTGSEWDELGAIVDLSDYYTANETDDVIQDAIENLVVDNNKLDDMPALTFKANKNNIVDKPQDITLDEARVILYDAVSITTSELQSLVTNNNVVVNRYYKVTDRYNIVYRGIETNLVDAQYVIIRVIKNNYYTISGINKGVMRKDTSYNEGDIAIWGGRVWIKGVGTQTLTTLPSDLLNANTGGTITNWTMIDTTNNTYYNDQILNVVNDITSSYFILSDARGNSFQTSNINLLIHSDWGCATILQNKCFYIINNSNYNLSNGQLYNIENNDIYGYITLNSNGDVIRYNGNNGNITNNTNTSVIQSNNNIGDIASNNNSGQILHNSNNGSIISNGINVTNIYYNSNSGNIRNNNNNGGVIYNSNNGNINDNINNGIIQGNDNNGSITTNSNNGYITSNNNSGSIVNNINPVTNIYQNSNSGNITNNSNVSVINNNSNNGSIQSNSNSSNITNNSNNGSIQSNSNIGSITNNSNGNVISSNSMRGSITYNSNTSSISNNIQSDTAPSTTASHIRHNNNAGVISNNTMAFAIAYNNNAGDIINNNNPTSFAYIIANTAGTSAITLNCQIAGNSNSGVIMLNTTIGAIISRKETGSIINNIIPGVTIVTTTGTITTPNIKNQYIFKGTADTSYSINTGTELDKGKELFIVNRSAFNITITSSIWDGGDVTSTVISAGTTLYLIFDGEYWTKY